MEVVRISKGGKITIPAEVRERWGDPRLVLDDRGDWLVVIPVPDDPIAAVRGAFAGSGPTTDEARRMSREEDAEIEERKLRLHGL